MVCEAYKNVKYSFAFCWIIARSHLFNSFTYHLFIHQPIHCLKAYCVSGTVLDLQNTKINITHDLSVYGVYILEWFYFAQYHKLCFIECDH